MEIRVSLCACVIYVILYGAVVATTQEAIRIGALIEKENAAHMRALEQAVEDVNMGGQDHNKFIPNFLVVLDHKSVDKRDSFNAQRKICRMTHTGIAAVFGPVSSSTVAHVQSICNSFAIPHIQWRWDPRRKEDMGQYSINLFPHHATLSKAYSDAIHYWRWSGFTVLYEDNDGWLRLQDIIKGARVRGNMAPKITVRKMELINNGYIPLLKELHARDEVNFLVDCKLSSVVKLLKSALQLGMVAYKYHFFFTTLDLYLLKNELQEFMHAGGNITSFRLIDPENKLVVQTRSTWVYRKDIMNSPLGSFDDISTETALAYDAFYLFAKGLKAMSESTPISTQSLSCEKPHIWNQGLTLINYLRSANFDGLSGNVRYEDGERKDFTLQLMILSKNRNDPGLKNMGSWARGFGETAETRLQVKEIPNHNIQTNAKDVEFTVLFVEKEPYVYHTTNASKIDETKKYGWAIQDNVQYVGFCIDVLNLIKKKQGFKLKLQKVSETGKLQKDNVTWGPQKSTMGILTNRENYDKPYVAIGDVTISHQREKDVDFTKPYMSLGITILYKKPVKKGMELFSFLKPLSVDVWVYMLAAYLCVSFVLFVTARFSPYEWVNPHPCNQDSEECENQFTVINCLWFTIGSLMQQGCEIAPSALSTRMVAGMWWFFTLIMISSYTANLAAFLTVERMVSDISNAEDLAAQNKILYGVPRGGSTEAFFRTNSLEPYKKMWNVMEENREKIESDDEAVERVKKGDYAYITESSTIEYIVERNCKLMQVGGLMDNKGYGFATPKNSIWREMFTQEILRLREEQELETLRKEYWEADICPKSSGSGGSANELGVDNVGGVFVFLMAGVLLGFLVSVCEFVFKARKNARKDKRSFCSEISDEFRFTVKCGSTKNQKKDEPEEVTDNGMQFMPLTSNFNHNPHNPYVNKEVYA